MSALAMILSAAIVVSDDGQPKVSAEMVRESEPLDVKGRWKAVVLWRGQVIQGEATLVDERFQFQGLTNNGIYIILFKKMVDEGCGNLRMDRNLGLDEQDGSRLRICVGTLDDESRPTSFRAIGKQCLLILHRVKPRK